MATLNPVLGGSVAFEQPVAETPASSAALNLAAGFLGTIGAPQQPAALTSDERQQNALRPFSERLYELSNSDLSSTDFVHHARALAQRAVATYPQYEGEITSILDTYDIGAEAQVATPVDTLTQGFNDFVGTPEGQFALAQSVTVNADGVVDEQATLAKAEEMYYSHLRLQSETTRLSRELEAVQGDNALFQERANRAVSQTLAPNWSREASGIVAGLVANGLSEEGVNYADATTTLRQARLEAAQVFRDQALNANIPPALFETQLEQALAPFDDTLEFIESSADDMDRQVQLVRTAQTYEAEQVLVEKIGILGAIPEFRQGISTILASRFESSDSYKAALESLAEESLRLDGSGGAANFNPFNSRNAMAAPSDAVDSVVSGTSILDQDSVASIAREFEGDSKGLANRITTAAGNILNSGGDPLTVSVSMRTMLESAEAANAPLDSSLLRGMFPLTSVSAMKNIIQGGGEYSQELHTQVTYFTATQATRNISIIEGAIRGSSQPRLRDAELHFQNGRYVLMTRDVNGGGLVPYVPEVVNNVPTLSFPNTGASAVLKAVENLNSLTRISNRILGEEETRETLSPFTPGVPTQEEIDELGDFLQSSQGDAQVGGSQGSDTLGFQPPEEVANDTDFMSNVAGIANRLGAKPEHLMRIIHFETGGSYDPAQRNAAGSGAIGLIQFMPQTAREMGTTTEALAGMSRAEQLGYVERYLEGKLAGVENPSLSDLYMAVLWPAAVGKEEDYQLWSRSSHPTHYRQNAGLDVDGDGVITKAEAAAKVIAATGGGTGYTGPSFPAPTAGPIISARPQARPEVDLPVANTSEGQAVTSSPRPQARPAQAEQVASATPQAESTASQRAVQEEAQRAQVSKLLARLNVNDAPSFSSLAEVEAMVEAGELKEGDVVILNGQVHVV